MSADIIARLVAAIGPDRTLDRLILRFISGRVYCDETFIGGPKDGTRELATAYPYPWGCWFAPRYTASIDAAATLVPHGWGYVLYSALANPPHAELHRVGECLDAWAPTPALSLCIAALMARAAT